MRPQSQSRSLRVTGYSLLGTLDASPDGADQSFDLVAFRRSQGNSIADGVGKYKLSCDNFDSHMTDFVLLDTVFI